MNGTAFVRDYFHDGPGTYRKISNRRGIACWSVAADGKLTYTNRRLETRSTTMFEVAKLIEKGYTFRD